jgi:hypothetical protein
MRESNQLGTLLCNFKAAAYGTFIQLWNFHPSTKQTVTELFGRMRAQGGRYLVLTSRWKFELAPGRHGTSPCTMACSWNTHNTKKRILVGKAPLPLAKVYWKSRKVTHLNTIPIKVGLAQNMDGTPTNPHGLHFLTLSPSDFTSNWGFRV